MSNPTNLDVPETEEQTLPTKEGNAILPLSVEPRDSTPDCLDVEAFLARARRLIAGDVRSTDYLVPTREVLDAVAAEIKRIEEAERFVGTPKARQDLLNDWTLAYLHSRQVVFARVTLQGVLVLASGMTELGLLAANNIEAVGFALMVPNAD